jgi:L,D-transpeptidase-like protein/putative peptidoglycan binding protein
VLRVAGRWTPAAIAVAVFVVVVGVGLLVTRNGDAEDSSTTTLYGNGSISIIDPNASTTTLVVPDTPAPSTVAQNSVPKVRIDRTVSKGLVGEDVRMVQQRLADLKFNPGPVDGKFGDYTVHAVWAFETLVMGKDYKEMTGKVTPELWDRMQDDVTVAPRRTNLTATHVEIYLPEQALVVFTDDLPVLIAHISSGQLDGDGSDFMKGKKWCEEVTISPGENGNEEGTEEIKDGRCGNAWTPGGTYAFYKKHDGIRQSALGGMYKPVYFNYGIAVHGAQNVPNKPDSHGCIRVNHEVADIFYDLIVNAKGTEAKPRGDQVYVFNGIEEPEAYGQKTGRFDTVWQEWRDKNSTTTSTSSTTSTTPTTVPGETTTVAPATAPPVAPTTGTTTTTTAAPAPTVPVTPPPETPAPTGPPGP